MVDWLQLQKLVFLRRTRIVLCVLLLAIGAFAAYKYAFSLPKLYESKARIWIQARLAVGSPSQQSSSFTPLLYFFNSPIATAIEIIRSSAVLTNVVNAANAQLPKTDAVSVDGVAGGLKIDAVKDADIIVVTYKNKDPKVARLVLQAVLSEFQKLNNEQASASAMQSRRFLEQQVIDFRKQRESTAGALKSFQETHHLVDIDQETGALVSQFSDLRTNIRDANISIAQLQKKIGYLEAQLGIQVDSPAVLQKITDDKVIEVLKERLSIAELKLSDAKARYGEDSARIARLVEVKKREEGAISERIRHLLGSNGVTLNENQLSATKPELVQELMAARIDELLQVERLSVLKAMIPGVESLLKAIPSQQLKFAELGRAEKVASDALSSAEKDLAAARLAESVSSEASNIQIIDDADLPRAPDHSDSYKLLMVSGGLLTILTAALYWIISICDPFIRDAKTVSRLIPFKVVGWLPEELNGDDLQEVHPLRRLHFVLTNWFAHDQCTKIAVVSADKGDGKTTVASGLAASLTANGQRVLLVDANRQAPALHTRLACALSSGFGQLVLEEGEADDLGRYVRTVGNNLCLITAGNSTPSDAVLSARVLEQIDVYAQNNFEVLLYDTPAVSESADALALLGTNVKFLLVIRLGHTEKQSLRLLAGQLQDIAQRGVAVITDAKPTDFARAQATQLRAISAEPVAEW